MAHERITALDLGLLGGPTAGSKQYRPPPRGVKELHRLLLLLVHRGCMGVYCSNMRACLLRFVH